MIYNYKHITKFESNSIYDSDYVNEVNKVVSVINKSSITTLRTYIELYPLFCGEMEMSGYLTKEGNKENHLFVRGIQSQENLLNGIGKVNNFIRSDFFQNWAEKGDEFKYAFWLDIGNKNVIEKNDSKVVNCYFNPNYMPVEADGDEAIFIGEEYLEYKYKFNKSMFDLLKSLSNIEYNLYSYRDIYIIIKK